MSAGREFEEEVKRTGNRLLEPPSAVDDLLSLLNHAEYILSKVEQSPAKSMQDALSPLTQALAAVELLRHSNVDVKVTVASCISEITRITAPDLPYDDDKMKDVFQLIVSSFENLPDKTSRSYSKRALILETVAKVRSCVVMLDLECDGLIFEMLQLFLSTIREYHSDNIFLSMETIMTLVLEESEDISPELLAPLLASVKKDNKDVLPIAVKLAEKVFQNCAVKLKPYLSQVIKSLDAAVDDYSNIIASISHGDSAVAHYDENVSNEPMLAMAEQEEQHLPVLPPSAYVTHMPNTPSKISDMNWKLGLLDKYMRVSSEADAYMRNTGKTLFNVGLASMERTLKSREVLYVRNESHLRGVKKLWAKLAWGEFDKKVVRFLPGVMKPEDVDAAIERSRENAALLKRQITFVVLNP